MDFSTDSAKPKKMTDPIEVYARGFVYFQSQKSAQNIFAVIEGGLLLYDKKPDYCTIINLGGYVDASQVYKSKTRILLGTPDSIWK